MPRVHSVKSSFSAGELAPDMLRREDLKAHGNGAFSLKNCIVYPDGSVGWRPGSAFISEEGGVRLLEFVVNSGQAYAVVLRADNVLSIYLGGTKITELASPWSVDQAREVTFIHSADELDIVHPDVPPKRLIRRPDMLWSISDWEYDAYLAASGRPEMPYHKFAAANVTLGTTNVTGTCQAFTNADVFIAEHLGVRIRKDGLDMIITEVQDARHAVVSVQEPLANTTATKNWAEQAWSAARGWPASGCYHQSRRVVGGSRDLPHWLWLSQSGKINTWALGTGLDAEAIAVPVFGDTVSPIRHVVSKTHLQIFAVDEEFACISSKVTPTSVPITRMSSHGTSPTRTIRPIDVDGTTVFVPRVGDGLYQLIYDDVRQAYTATDLSLLAKHLVNDPVAMAYDQGKRWLYVVNADGTGAILTTYQAEEITAWTPWIPSVGALRDIARIGDDIHLLSEGRIEGLTSILERLDYDLALDCALSGEDLDGAATWAVPDHLAGGGTPIQVIASDATGTWYHGALDPDAGETVTLDKPATRVEMGIGFEREIIPPPPALATDQTPVGWRQRLHTLRLQLIDTLALRIDVGMGLRDVACRRSDAAIFDAAPQSVNTGVELRGIGWNGDADVPLWKIKTDCPLPCRVASAKMDIEIGHGG